MIVVVASEKGGTGKTTIATNLAIMRALNGKQILLIDADSQQSSMDFSRVRSIENNAPSITCMPVVGKGIDKIISKFNENFDDILVDVGGRDSSTMRSAISIADKLIIPFLPGSLDAWSTEKMADLVTICKKEINPNLIALSVLNKADVNPKNKDNNEVIELIKIYRDISFIASTLYYRVSYRRAIGEGKSVVELTGNNKDSKAMLEVNTLYHSIYGN